MKALRLLAFCILISFFSTIKAQKIAEVNLTLLDGNVIRGMTLFNDIELQTAYGRLTIPIANVNSLVIGIGKDNASISTVLPLLKLLNTSANEEARKSAYNDLVKMGPKVLFTIDQFLGDPKNASTGDYTGEYTLDNAINDIRSQANLTADVPYLDVITIDNLYTMGGTYTFTKLEVKTEYGILSIPKEKIRSMDVSVVNPVANGDFPFRLLANKHISGNQTGGWLKTGIMLKTGQTFQITASGEVVLASLSNGKYKPDGSYRTVNGTDGANGASEDADYGGNTGAYPTYGQVVYRIGEGQNDMTKAGKKLNATAKQSGMLYLAIYETVFNSANTGFYTVKVQTGAK